MRIAITGVPSTGKTSLSKAIAERAGVPYMEEQQLMDAAYKWCDDNGIALSTRHLPEFTPEDFSHWQRGFLYAKYRFDTLYPDYVADGCPLLTITYVLTTCWQTFTRLEVEDAYTNLSKMAKSYDGIYYLPFGVLPIVDDGRRTTNINFHRMQDLVLRGLMDTHEDDVTIVEIHTADFERRVEMIMADVNQILEQEKNGMFPFLEAQT